MWVAHRDTDLQGLEKILRQSRDLGMENLQQIAEQECAAVGLSADVSLSTTDPGFVELRLGTLTVGSATVDSAHVSVSGQTD